MTRVVYVHEDGTREEVEVEAGRSVMQVAQEHSIRGIVGECGGSLACATCHVYVDPHWAERLLPPSEAERDMLEGVLKIRDTSRLSCQIKMTSELDGLVVHVPDEQF